MIKTTTGKGADVKPNGAALRVPTEIWLEIVSDSHFLILGSEKDGIPRSLLLLSRGKIESSPKTIPLAHREWPEILRTLSQTCRTFRAIFLPLLWEHVEACFAPKNGRDWSTRVADVLLDRSNGLMKRENQDLARFVRVFSVSLSSHRIAAVVPLFARCLVSLPNLDTLHILYLESQWERNVTVAFRGVNLPGVRTIILPTYAHGILAACPSVRDVSCNDETGETLFETLISCCPEVERIQGFELTSAKLRGLFRSLLKLREVAVPANMDMSSLGDIKSLSIIELIAKRWEYVDETEIDPEDFSPSTAYKRKLLQTKQRRIDATRAVLRASAGKAPKRIKMSYWQDITGMVGVTEHTYGQYWVRAEDFDA
ncbi:hypothetical protein B0H19DRAFT_1150933 [Mycena capillaripes]|nr:hypothetical protein B0H19DRAFT_1150933 [Mycena capillaripes]